MIDNDGAFTYSSIQSINPIAASAQINIYPNPVSGSAVYISLDKPSSAPISIKIEDITGRTYSRYTVNASNFNYNNIPVNVQKLGAGTYLLKVETANTTVTRQIIINH